MQIVTREQFMEKCGTQHPYLSNENVVPVAITKNEIRYHKSYEILSRCSFYREWAKGEQQEIRCFITGHLLCIAQYDVMHPWVANKEHLYAFFDNKLGAARSKKIVDKPWNIVPCSGHVNYILGHTPLLIKLYIRDQLKNYSWDRNDLNMDKDIMSKFIYKITSVFRHNGQGTHVYWRHKSKNDQFKPLLDAIDNFNKRLMNMPEKNRKAFMEQPLDVDVLGIFNSCQ